MTVMKEGSPVRADKTPQNSPGVATYNRSCADIMIFIDSKGISGTLLYSLHFEPTMPTVTWSPNYIHRVVDEPQPPPVSTHTCDLDWSPVSL